MIERGLRRRRRARPGGRDPARGPLRRARLHVDVVERPPRRARARDARRLRRGLRRLDLGVAVMALDRHDPIEINRHIERLGLDRDRLWLGVGAGFSKKPLDPHARARARAARRRPGRAPRARRDGPEDVRARRRQVRRRLLQLDEPASSPRGAREHVASRRRGGGPRARRRSSATSAPRSATTPSERLAKEESFYRDLHDGYRNHFDRLGEPEGTVGVAAADRGGSQAALAEHHEALDVVVVRGLASASTRGDERGVAEAAAPAAGPSTAAARRTTRRASGRPTRTRAWSPRCPASRRCRGRERVDRRGEGLDLAEVGVELARQRDLELVQRLERALAHHHDHPRLDDRDLLDQAVDALGRRRAPDPRAGTSRRACRRRRAGRCPSRLKLFISALPERP